jgi:hypothetical protein
LQAAVPVGATGDRSGWLLGAGGWMGEPPDPPDSIPLDSERPVTRAPPLIPLGPGFLVAPPFPGNRRPSDPTSSRVLLHAPSCGAARSVDPEPRQVHGTGRTDGFE